MSTERPAAIGTFHKCGSGWFRAIFWHVADQLGYDYLPSPQGNGLITKPVVRGGTPLHVFPGGAHKNIKEVLGDQALSHGKIVLCPRHPKDALVSQYFSWKISHKNNTPAILKYREILQDLSVEDGLALFLKDRQFAFGNQFEQWMPVVSNQKNIHVIRYEDLHADFHGSLNSVADFIGLDAAKLDIDKIQHETSFETITSRKPGDEKVDSHRRKGVSGDHKNYFTPELDSLFEETYGSMNDVLGY